MYPIFFLIFGWEKIRKKGDNILLSLGKKLVIQSRFQTFFFKKKAKRRSSLQRKTLYGNGLKGKKGGCAYAYTPIKEAENATESLVCAT